MRFQDAAAVTYAAIQADPVVGAAASLLADANATQRLLAARGHERRDARPGWLADDVPGALRTGRAVRTRALGGHPGRLATIADDRGDQARNQLRGALVESLTAGAGAAVGAGAVRRERRILFDGVPAEDVTRRRHRRAGRCCRSPLQVVHDQLDDARANAEAEGERLRVTLVVFGTL